MVTDSYGETYKGLAQINQGLTIIQMIGAEIEVQHGLSLQAEVYGQAGQVEVDLKIINNALRRLELNENEDRSAEAELYQVKGELLLMLESPDAESSFHQAITIATMQNAKMWQLRATVSLCRLWQSQGKGTEAYEKLSVIYNWFTEGFDTLDLQKATALLDQLIEGQS